MPDKAIDAFVPSLEVNTDTLSSFSAGYLLRKRGEVERDVRIHQNLLFCPVFNTEQLQYGLSIDCVKSGLFDCSEELLVLLVKQGGLYKIDALKQFLETYQDENEWLLGLGVLESLLGFTLVMLTKNGCAARAHLVVSWPKAICVKVILRGLESILSRH